MDLNPDKVEIGKYYYIFEKFSVFSLFVIVCWESKLKLQSPIFDFLQVKSLASLTLSTQRNLGVNLRARYASDIVPVISNVFLLYGVSNDRATAFVKQRLLCIATMLFHYSPIFTIGLLMPTACSFSVQIR